MIAFQKIARIPVTTAFRVGLPIEEVIKNGTAPAVGAGYLPAGHRHRDVSGRQRGEDGDALLAFPAKITNSRVQRFLRLVLSVGIAAFLRAENCATLAPGKSARAVCFFVEIEKNQAAMLSIEQTSDLAIQVDGAAKLRAAPNQGCSPPSGDADAR